MCHTGQQLSEEKTEETTTTTSSAPRPAGAAQQQPSVDSSSYGMSRDDESFPSSSEQGKSIQGESTAAAAPLVAAARPDLVVKNIIECELSGDEALQETVVETAAAVQRTLDIDSDNEMQAEAMEAMREESREAFDLLATEAATASSVYHEEGATAAAAGAAAGAGPSVAFSVQPPSFEEEEDGARRMSQEMHEVTEIAAEFVTDIETRAIARSSTKLGWSTLPGARQPSKA